MSTLLNNSKLNFIELLTKNFGNLLQHFVFTTHQNHLKKSYPPFSIGLKKVAKFLTEQQYKLVRLFVKT